MGITVDVAYKSLNKFSEILCGDQVEILKTADSDILILADGMGSGVKANILSTLTSKILGTMFLNGATLEECVDTIVQTLPVCQVRHVAYSTFSILQVFQNGHELPADQLSAKAQGDRVVLEGEAIQAGVPTQVCLATTGWYAMNLYNSAGIPAVPAKLSL